MSIESRSRQYGKVFDHWQIKEFLGSGSGGKTAVFRLLRSDSSWGVCALKIVNLIEARGDVEALSDFRRREYEAARAECSRSAEQEVRLMDELRGNTNIVDYLDHTFVDWSDESGFGRDLLIRMELLEDLRSDLKNGRMFSQEGVLKIGRDICAALMLCHKKNILHRDVKPENIFRNKDGNYKLGDFGVSRVLDACPGAVASTGIGTYEYWPAEQMTGRYDKRVDLYSLGLVLYELSNGNRLPFAASTYATGKEVSLRLSGSVLPTPSEAGPILAKVILKATAFKPEDRYQSAEEMLKALDWVGRKEKAPASVDTLDFWEQNIPTAPARPAAAPKSAFKAQPAQGSEHESRTKPVRSENNTDEKKSKERLQRKKKKRPLFGAGLLLCALLLCGAAVFAGKSIGESAWKTRKYSAAKELLEGGNFKEAAAVFEVLGDYRDSAEQLEKARLAIEAKTAEVLLEEEKIGEAIVAFETTGDFQDNTEQQNARQVVDYATAESLAQSGKTAEAAMAFYALGEKERSFELWDKVTAGDSVSAGSYHTVGLKSDGTVVSAGTNGYGQCDLSDWTDIIAVSAGSIHTVGLKNDGTVVAAGYNLNSRCNVESWKDIVAVSAGMAHTVGLKSDGTVLTVGSNTYGKRDVDDWMDIIVISAGENHTVGLKSDGTVVAVGSNRSAQCNVSNWADIVAISAGKEHTVGLKSDGTVVAVGNNRSGQCNVSNWTDIVAISAGNDHTVGLRADGTVVAVGYNSVNQCRVGGWTDIVSISAGPYQTFGLKAEGTLLATGDNRYDQLNVQDWTDIMLPNSKQI